MIQESGFHAVDNAVGIMDGVDEGIFSWFTVNFLLGKGQFCDTLDSDKRFVELTIVLPHCDIYPQIELVELFRKR